MGRELKKRNSLPIAKAPDKWLTTVLGPFSQVVERTGIPDHFVEELAHSDGMAGWTRSAGLKGPVFGIRHVRHVVWGIEVFAIPAANIVISKECGLRNISGVQGSPYVGKRTAVMIPVLHGLSGKSRVCGSRVSIWSRQVNVSCLKRSASCLERALTSPMNIRKPWSCQSMKMRLTKTRHLRP